MMKYYSLLFGCLCLGILAACSGEDELTAIPDTTTNYFAPDPNATDPESVLRRKFYEEENSYLLFNDTLRHEPRGIDFNGDTYYFTETLDMGYLLGQNSSTDVTKYAYEYLQTMDEKEDAVLFLKQYILPQLSSQLRPFSWFITRSITNLTFYNTYEALNGQRSIAIAVGYSISDMTTEEKEVLANRVLSATLSSSISAKEKELTDFYAFGDEFYGNFFSTDDNPDSDLDINMKHLNEAGFIVSGEFWGMEMVGIYPTKNKDVSSFIELVTKYNEQEIEEIYGEYKIVIEKAQIMRNLITSQGFIFK